MKPLFVSVSALFALANLCFLVDNTGYSLIFIPLMGLIASSILHDRIGIHYQFKIFAVLLGVVSLLLLVQILSGRAIISFSQPNLLVAESIALALILLLRTHSWLKIPVTFSILAGMILLPQGLWAIIAVVLIYMVLSHTEVRGRLLNLLKVGGFIMVSLAIMFTISPAQITERLHEGFPTISPTVSDYAISHIPGIWGNIINISFYLLIAGLLLFSFRRLYNIFAITFRHNPPEEIEHNNILMILAVLILVVICLPLGMGAALQPVLWLSFGILMGSVNQKTLGK